jgi:hypothetical protein
MMGWLNRFPLVWLMAVAGWLAVLPVGPESHLIEKLRMLSQGTLTQALDIFDLALHTVPLVLLATSLWRMKLKTKPKTSGHQES